MSDTTAEPPQDALTKAQNDLKSLDRVSHRLALLTDDKLPEILDKLLPRLLLRVGENHQELINLGNGSSNSPSEGESLLLLKQKYDAIHAKLIETLSHVMKRARVNAQCGLPCQAILELLLLQKSSESLPKNNVDPFTMNLSLAFLTIGVPRCSDFTTLLKPLLILYGYSSNETYYMESTNSKRLQSNQFAHLLLKCLEGIVVQEQQQQQRPSPSASVRSSTGGNPNESTPQSSMSTAFQQAKQLLQRQDSSIIASSLYDLLLDVLLFQPTRQDSPIPPDGLSASGAQRLGTGQSNTARDWLAEMAIPSRRNELKQRLLDLIAPSRTWALFMSDGSSIDDDTKQQQGETTMDEASGNTADVTMDEANGTTNDVSKKSSTMNLSRTLALLVVASGDPALDVADRAKSYLKVYFDAFRGKSLLHGLGDVIALSIHLLSLCVGEQQADAAIGQVVVSTIVAGDSATLGTQRAPMPTDPLQATLNSKRRPVSESTMTALAQFVATNVLRDQPNLFDEVDLESIQALSALSNLLASRTLASVSSASGLTKLKGRPYAAAADLLNAFAIRLTTYYDSQAEEQQQALNELMAKSMAVACSVLEVVASRPPTSSANQRTVIANEGNVAVRDSSYGVLCTMSRSQFVQAPEGFVFNAGQPLTGSTNGTLSVSIKTAKRLFGCAANEEEKLRHRAVAALDALLAAYCRVYTAHESVHATLEKKPMTEEVNPWSAVSTAAPSSFPHQSSVKVDKSALCKSLLPLLWTAAQVHLPKASRVAACRWSSQLLMELDMTSACHILCFLAGDVDPTAASTARQGLGLTNQEAEHIPLISDDLRLPNFAEFVSTVFAEVLPTDSSFDRRQRFWDFSRQGQTASLRLGLLSLLSDLYGGDEAALLSYLSAICRTLEHFMGKKSSASSLGLPAIELLEEAALALLTAVSTSVLIRDSILHDKVAITLKDLLLLSVECESSRARRHFAGVVGKLLEDVQLWNRSSPSDSSFEAWLVSYHVLEPLTTCNTQLASIRANNSISVGHVHGCAYLSAHIVRACRLRALDLQTTATNADTWDMVARCLNALGFGVAHKDEIIGNACADALKIAYSFDGIDAPVLGERLFECSAAALSSVAAALTKFGDGDTIDVLRAIKLTRAAGTCLVATCGMSSPTGRADCVNALIGLLGSKAFRQEEEVALVAGEALALFADSLNNITTIHRSDRTWPEGFDDSLARQMPPHEYVLYTLLRSALSSTSPFQRTACAPALAAVAARVARGIHMGGAYRERLLAQEMVLRLGDIQQAFIQLLSDPKIRHLSRESCCLGLAACRGIAGSIGGGATSDELNRRLLSAFGQSTHYARSAMIETREQAAARRAREAPERETMTDAPVLMEQFGFEIEVGGVSNMGEAALGAYREMAAASVALGRDDILYTLLFLSVAHPTWSMDEYRDRYNAASLVGQSLQIGPTSNGLEMRNILRPHMGRLIPRLLRARYDPNKQTREQMTSLWNGLTGGGAEARDMITQHFSATFDTLLEDTTSKLWRARCGALGALADVIVGREWDELGGGGPVLDDDVIQSETHVTAAVRLLRLWRTATRSLDDVRGAVRDAGEALARGVKALTVRLCDPKQSSVHRKRLRNEEKSMRQRDAAAAAATSLRWLCRHGLAQPCAEATGICVSTLIEVISLPSISSLLYPVLPDLIRSLLLAMSGLEPAALNYLQLRTGDQEGLERIRLQISQSGPLFNALTKCLDIVPSLDETHQRAVIPQLDAALRLSAGFATRAAAADAVSTLCSTCPNAFRFSGSPKLNPAVRLLRAFYYASERERGDGSKDKMIHALGNLAALCPGVSVRSLAIRACDSYNRSTGNSDDPLSRRASAAALRAIATRASEQFSDGHVWGDKILPTAFLGCKDSDKKTAFYWKEVWDEGGAVVNVSDSSASDTYGSRLEEHILHRLVEACIHALKDVSWSRRTTGATALVQLSDLGVLDPLPPFTSTSSAPDPIKMGRARYRSEAASSALHECVELISKPRLWTGKSDVIDAAVHFAAKWASAEAGRSDTIALYGWNDTVIQCPWKPVTMSQVCTDDLFLEDKWFLDADNNAEIAMERDDEALGAETMETEEEEAMDVEELDNALAQKEKEGNAHGLTEPCNFMPVVFTGLCRLLLQQGLTATQSYSDYSLPYRASALKGLKHLLASLPDKDPSIKVSLYAVLAPSLQGFLDQDDEKPVLVAAVLECLAELFYESFGGEESSETQSQSVSKLMVRLKSLGGEMQSAWTVRQASTHCIASLVRVCQSEELRLPSSISLIVQCAEVSLKDKFFKVRLAGVTLLESLVSRAGTSSDRNLLVLEAILPHKEAIVRQLRLSLRDSEAAVTALGTKVMSQLSWWP